MYYVARTVVVLFRSIQNLESVCLTYVDLKHVEKFFRENILKHEYVESFIQFVRFCCRFCESEPTMSDKQMYLECIDCILRENWIWLRFNEMENYEIINFVFDEFQKLRLFNTNSCQTWIKEIPDIYDDDSCKQQQEQLQLHLREGNELLDDDDDAGMEKLSSRNDKEDKQSDIDEENMAKEEENRVKQIVRVEAYKKAIFISKLIEAQIDKAAEFEFESVRRSDSLLLIVSIFVYYFTLCLD